MKYWKPMAAMFACLLVMGACGDDSDDTTSIGSEDATLTVVNDSSFDIEALFITPTDSSTWGPDRLQGDGLLVGEEVTIFDIPCDVFDTRVIDTSGVECILLDVDLCFDDATWVIDDDLLASCDFVSQQAGQATP